MDTALSGLIILTLLLTATFTAAQGYLSVQDSTMRSYREMGARLSDRLRTDLTPLGAETVGESMLEVTLRNEGETKWAEADFDQWDVIVEYEAKETGEQVVYWVPYGVAVEGRRWDVEGIYLDASSSTPEELDLNILNPGEEMVVQIWISPTVEEKTAKRAVFVAPNGISASTIFAE